MAYARDERVYVRYGIKCLSAAPLSGCCLKKNQNAPRPSDVVSHIQRIGCQPEKNYFTRWPIPLVVR